MGVGWVCYVCVNPISLQWSLNVSQLIAPRLRMYCYSSINLSQLLAAWAQRLPTLLKLAIGLAWDGCVMGTSMRGLIPTLWDAWNLGLGTQWFWLGLVALTMPRRDGDDIPTSWNGDN